MYTTNGKSIYNADDGVIIDLEEVKKIKEQQAVENFNNAMQELDKLGVSSNLLIVKYRNREYQCIEIKREFEFNKEFRVEMRDLMLSGELSKNARCFIGTLTPFISFPSNAIHINYENPNYDDLMKVLDMSKNTLVSTLKELEDKNIIHRSKINGQMIIYFNPFLYCGGYCVDRNTYEIFKKSEFNPIKN